MRGLACLTLLVGCSGTEHTTTFPPLPAAATNASLAGHRCSGQACTCRGDAEGDAAEQQPVPEGYKRFEFRVGTVTGMAWVTVAGKEVLHKDVQRAEDCFYLDLPAGKHTVALRAKGQNPEGGVGFALRIKEHNPKGPWWYDSFTLECGIPGPCTREVLVAWKKEIDSNRRALRDPCGSARIQSLGWETGRMPDALHPEEVSVNFLLSVPPIDPTEAPGTETCPDAQ
jgi:hypothetical protein